MSVIKKIVLPITFLNGIAIAQHEQGNIKQNYDYGCEDKTISTDQGDLMTVVCFDKQLNNSSKIYLREKLLVETSDMIIHNLNHSFIKNINVFVVLKKNQLTNSFEKYFYLIDLSGNNGKIYKFGIKNAETLNPNIEGFGGKLKIVINKEINFTYDKKSLTYPLNIKNKNLYLENLND